MLPTANKSPQCEFCDGVPGRSKGITREYAIIRNSQKELSIGCTVCCPTAEAVGIQEVLHLLWCRAVKAEIAAGQSFVIQVDIVCQGDKKKQIGRHQIHEAVRRQDGCVYCQVCESDLNINPPRVFNPACPQSFLAAVNS